MIADSVSVQRTEILLSVKIKGEFGEITMCGEIIDKKLVERGVAPAFYDKDEYLELPDDVRQQIKNKAIIAFKNFQ